MRLPRTSALLLALALLVPSAASARPAARVVVNRVALAPAQVVALSRHLGAAIPPGRYWYDGVSGAWGVEGGPAQGRLPPRLGIGGRLRRDASGGGTGVVVNGRELHPIDVRRLQAAGVPVQRGRFWLDHRGIGGVEGGPASFDLSVALGLRGGKRRKGSVLSTWDRTGVAVF